jgi:putative colanic acid biosynthesis UDP-glucose lipid carrier transferase
MITNRTRGIYQLTLIVQCALVALAFWVWYLLWNARSMVPGAAFDRYLASMEFILLGLVISGSLARVSSSYVKPDFDIASSYALRQLLAAAFYVFFFVFALRDGQISPVFLISFLPLMYLTLFGCNRYLPSVLSRWLLQNHHQENLLLIGPAGQASMLQGWLSNKRQLGLNVVGLLATDPEVKGGKKDVSFPVVGDLADLEDVVKAHGITHIVLTDLPQNEVLSRVVRFCEQEGVRLVAINDLGSRFRHAVAVSEDQGLFFIGLREEALENPFNTFLKRAFDLIISIPVVLFVLPPLCLIVWVAHRLQSPGPLFFLQPRVGMQRQRFTAFKFRTMHVKDSSDEVRYATTNDPRIFRAGQWFRKLSIDEFPQFLNVLKGEMSVVGPRPHALKYDEDYARVLSNYYVRAVVKPGITGLAQVSGFRGDVSSREDIVNRVEADIQYLENWSFWLDCFIILRTASQVFLPPKTAK